MKPKTYGEYNTAPIQLKGVRNPVALGSTIEQLSVSESRQHQSSQPRNDGVRPTHLSSYWIWYNVWTIILDFLWMN